MTPLARYCQILEEKMSNRMPDDPEARRAMVKRLRREGVPVVELARLSGVSKQTIQQWCSEAKPRFFHSNETKEQFRSLRQSGLSTRKACAQLGLCRSTVMDW